MVDEPEDERDVLDTARAGGLAVRGGMLRIIGFAAGSLVALVAVALVTRHLGQARFGEFQKVVALITVVSTIADAGMSSLAVREYAQLRAAERDRLMASLFGLRLALTLLGVVLATALAAALDYSTAAQVGTVAMGLGVLVAVVQTTFMVPLQARLRLGWVTAITTASQVLLAFVYVALVAFDAGVAAFLAAAVPVNVVLALWSLVLARGAMPLVPIMSLQRWGELLRPTLAFAAAISAGVIYVYLAQLLTSQIAGDEQGGVFGVSFRVFLIVGAIPGMLVAGAFPLLSRAARDDRTRLAGAIESTYAGMLALGGAAALGCVVGAPLIVEVIGGSVYAESVGVLRVQGFALLGSFLVAPASYALLALHLHRSLLLVNAAAALLVACVVAVLAAEYGARGAAFGTLIGESTLALGVVAMLRRSDRRLGLRPSLLARTLIALGLGLSVLALGLPAFVATPLGLLIYAVAAVALGVLPRDVQELVPGHAGELLTRWSR